MRTTTRDVGLRPRGGAAPIIATHSPILLAYPNAAILQFGHGPLAQVAFEETEHFTVTRDFLNRYPAMLRILLEDDDVPRNGQGSA